MDVLYPSHELSALPPIPGTCITSYYPSRDCVEEDAAWALNPSSLTAPCCANATLVRASVAMMTEALAYGITELDLETLLSGGTDPSYSSSTHTGVRTLD